MNGLAAHYSRFRVGERILLTGHSHQAWPDVALEAQQRAWLDAAELVDAKWDKAEEQAQLVRAGFARLLGDTAANIALGQNTHELVTRWLSALPLRARPRLVTTDGEFHSIRRQVDRLEEEGTLQIVRVAASPAATLAERLATAADASTACVMVSSVLFETAEIVPHLGELASACSSRGVALLVDAYHHLNVVPFDLAGLGLSAAFITGGGYKYCQLGEGNCFLRVPPDRHLRPVLTGWFAEFSALDGAHRERRVSYGPGAAAFGGATYDPSSHYRAAAVFDFHHQHGLTADRLHGINHRQVLLLKTLVEQLDLDPAVAQIVAMPDAGRGGFLAIRSLAAADLSRRLREAGVHSDARGSILRLGPAPYLIEDQLREAIEILSRALSTKT